ncbi:HNH endonuclease signature motif containing protein [Bordetella sp. 15P40C-2]|uniref:HNH endonuclease n=1 Tax=Bordetella sp. 15P40C-2 TaxID=2572246 RepID=UPI0019207578
MKKAEQSGRGGRPWRRLRDQILERDGYLCQCEDCQRRPLPLVAHEVDHIDNTRGPDGKLNNDPSNLRAVNEDCHKRITQAQAQRARRPVW